MNALQNHCTCLVSSELVIRTMELLKSLSETRHEVLQAYNVTEENVKGHIADLKIWLSNQPHLPASLLEDGLLERFLLKNKFSMEKTKTKIENYCILRKNYKKFYENYSEIIPSKEIGMAIPMFRITDDLNRVVICKILDEKKFDFLRSVRGVLLMLEIESRMDYSCGDKFIVDLGNCSAALMTKIHFFVLKDALTLAIKAYSARVRSIHLINCPKFINILMTILKTIVPQKIFGRIRIHHSPNTLFEDFPKYCLPVDYGGDLASLKEITAQYDKVFEECSEMFKIAIQTESSENTGCSSQKLEDSVEKLQID